MKAMGIFLEERKPQLLTYIRNFAYNVKESMEPPEAHV